MSYIKKINGYDIKDSNAREEIQNLNLNKITTYDNVNDLKSDTSLVKGQHVMTKGYYSINDGGGSEYYITDSQSELNYVENLQNGLKAVLIPVNNTVNLKQFGAKGDGITDDSIHIQNAINYSLSNENISLTSDNSIYFLSTGLIISDPSNINYKSKIFDFSKATFKTDQNITLIEIAKPWLKLYINELIGNSEGTGILLSGANWHNTIEIDNIRYFEYGIKMLPTQTTNNGIMYTNIKWTYMINTYNIYADINGSYINQNRFLGGLLGGGANTYGVYVTDTSANPNNLSFNGNLFEHIGFETVAHPIHLEWCGYSIFKDFRFEEQQNSDDYITLINCVCMVFETNNSYMFLHNRVSDNYSVTDNDIMNWKKYCNIYRIYAGNYQDSQNALTTREFTVVNGHNIYLDYRRYEGQYGYFESTSDTSEFETSYNPVTYLNLVAGANDLNLKLTQPYSFLHSGYDNFIINIQSLLDPHKITIKDYLNNVIFDSSNYNITKGANINKKFEIKLTGRKNIFVVNQLD